MNSISINSSKSNKSKIIGETRMPASNVDSDGLICGCEYGTSIQYANHKASLFAYQGHSLGRWLDISYSGNDLAQPDLDKMPTINNAISFDGQSQYLKNDELAKYFEHDFSIYLIAYAHYQHPKRAMLWSAGNSKNGAWEGLMIDADKTVKFGIRHESIDYIGSIMQRGKIIVNVDRQGETLSLFDGQNLYSHDSYKSQGYDLFTVGCLRYTSRSFYAPFSVYGFYFYDHSHKQSRKEDIYHYLKELYNG